MSTRPSETDSQLTVPLLTRAMQEEQEVVYVKDDSVLHQTMEERFHSLVKIWQADRPPNLRIADMVTHPAYQAIIGLGP
ncbi:MAG: hypothetical protein FD167_3091, partial [bacterium]